MTHRLSRSPRLPDRSRPTAVAAAVLGLAAAAQAQTAAPAAPAPPGQTDRRHRLSRLHRERAEQQARGQRHRRCHHGRGHRQVPRHQPGRVAAAHPGRRHRPRRRRGPHRSPCAASASDFTRVRINGIEALATTGGTDSSGGANRSRGFDFNVFASELFNSVTVRKSASAEVDEGSLGATVDLQTDAAVRHRRASPPRSRSRAATTTWRARPTRACAFLVSNTFMRPQGRRAAVGRLLQAPAVRRRLQHRALGQRRLVAAAGARRSALAEQPQQLHRHHLRPGRAGRGTAAQHAGRKSPPMRWPATPPTSTRVCRATAA